MAAPCVMYRPDGLGRSDNYNDARESLRILCPDAKFDRVWLDGEGSHYEFKVGERCCAQIVTREKIRNPS
jgi:hypothetical protein